MIDSKAGRRTLRRIRWPERPLRRDVSGMVRFRALIALPACILALALAFSAGSLLTSTGKPLPRFGGWVNDTAGMLSAAERLRIADTLEQYRLQTHHQMAVLTVASLGGEKIEAFSLRTARAWGVGTKGRDDGILVTLAMQERQARIELGTGMQRFISDAEAKQIMDAEMRPLFSKGDFYGGLERGLERLMDEGRRFVVESESAPTPP